MEISDSTGQGQLLRNLVLFGRVLRNAGVEVAPGQLKELARALAFIDIGNRIDFYAAARAILVHRREDIEKFDRAFGLFWRRRDYESFEEIVNGLGRPQARTPQNRILRSSRNHDASPGEPDDAGRVKLELRFTYSSEERLRYKDFAEFSREELEEAKRLIQHMPWTMGTRPSRRSLPGGRDYFDARAVMRRYIRSGGDLLEFEWRQKKDKPRQLVALCDISGSMETYTRVLLHFLHSMKMARTDVEAFVFATRLTRITRQLRLRDVDAALQNVSATVADWSGGTRIGEAIKTFNFVWSRRVLRPGAVMLIISDGWDRGEPELLGREMARLERNVYRIIWLNPLAASPGYEPLTRGLQAALPFVDDFLPAHNLVSLEQLFELLHGLGYGAFQK